MSAPDVYLAFGSNLGNRERNLAAAIAQLPPLVTIEAVSSLYETDPVGPKEQPPYLNAVCRGTTHLDPEALLRHALDVERALGRRRTGERWGPRPIDIDLLVYGDAVVEGSELRLPHPELANRAFVLVPLAELAPDLRVPGLSDDVAALLARVDRAGVRLRAEQGWERGFS